MFKNTTEYYYIARLAVKDDITHSVVMEPVYGIACISISCTQIRALVKDPGSLHNGTLITWLCTCVVKVFTLTLSICAWHEFCHQHSIA